MDLASRVSADIIRMLPDEQLRKLNKLLDDDNVSEEQIKAILKDSGVDLVGIIKKSVGGE